VCYGKGGTATLTLAEQPSTAGWIRVDAIVESGWTPGTDDVRHGVGDAIHQV